jgi:hypothetical protein
MCALVHRKTHARRYCPWNNDAAAMLNAWNLAGIRRHLDILVAEIERLSTSVGNMGIIAAKIGATNSSPTSRRVSGWQCILLLVIG